MRFTIELVLSENIITKDKNKLAMYIIKKAFEISDKEFFEKIYIEEKNLRKDFVFSLYLGDCKFNKETIFLKDNKILLNISTYSKIEGIILYNGFLKLKNNKTLIKVGITNEALITAINVKKEMDILKNYSENFFKTLSPIAIKEHSNNNKLSYYHNLNTNKGLDILKSNQKKILAQKFPDYITQVDKFKIFLESEFKEVKVKYSNIIIPACLCTLKLAGHPTLIDYIYKAGIGSKTNSGFGMLEII